MSLPGFDKLTTQAVENQSKANEQAKLESQVDTNLKRKEIKEKKEGKMTMPSLMGAAKQNEAMREIVNKQDALKYEKRRKEVVRKVKKYKKNSFFKDILKDVPMPREGATLEEWIDTHEEIKSVMGSADAVEQLWAHIQQVTDALVMFSLAKPGWFRGKNFTAPQNLSFVIRQPETRQKLAKEVEELAIEYDKWLSRRVELRFLMAYVGVALQTAQYNEMMTQKLNMENAWNVKKEGESAKPSIPQ